MPPSWIVIGSLTGRMFGKNEVFFLASTLHNYQIQDGGLIRNANLRTDYVNCIVPRFFSLVYSYNNPSIGYLGDGLWMHLMLLPLSRNGQRKFHCAQGPCVGASEEHSTRPRHHALCQHDVIGWHFTQNLLKTNTIYIKHSCHGHRSSKLPNFFSWYLIKFPWPKKGKLPMFLPAFNGIKSSVLKYFKFPWLFFKMSPNFPGLRNKTR